MVGQGIETWAWSSQVTILEVWRFECVFPRYCEVRQYVMSVCQPGTKSRFASRVSLTINGLGQGIKQQPLLLQPCQLPTQRLDRPFGEQRWRPIAPSKSFPVLDGRKRGRCSGGDGSHNGSDVAHRQVVLSKRSRHFDPMKRAATSEISQEPVCRTASSGDCGVSTSLITLVYIHKARQINTGIPGRLGEQGLERASKGARV